MVWEGISLKWYEILFNHSPDLWAAFGKSLWIAIWASLVATLIGTLGAIGLYWHSVKHKRVITVLTLLPLLLPEIIMGVSLPCM